MQYNCKWLLISCPSHALGISSYYKHFFSYPQLSSIKMDGHHVGFSCSVCIAACFFVHFLMHGLLQFLCPLSITILTAGDRSKSPQIQSLTGIFLALLSLHSKCNASNTSQKVLVFLQSRTRRDL